MSKLYILNNKKGLVKIGITDDDVKKRIKNINKSLPSSLHFCEVTSFNVEKNVAKIESIIHDFLNQGLLNITYLKEKINIIEFDSILNNKTEGYTEMFLSNPLLIKNIFVFLGYAGLIDFKAEDIEKINTIKGFDFDFLYKNYPDKIINLSMEDINNTTQKIETNCSKNILEKINDISSKNDLSISLSEEGDLLIKNETSSFSNKDLLSLNDDELKSVLSNKPVNIQSDKSIIKSIVNKFHIKTKNIRTQSKLSIRKEEKLEELNTFFNDDRRNEIYEIMSEIMLEAGEMFPNELLVLDKENFIKKYNKIYGNEAKKINIKDYNLLKPNFNVSDIDNIFQGFIKSCQKNGKFEYFTGCNPTEYTSHIIAIGYIYKILYESKDKISDFENLKDFLKSLKEFACVDFWGMNSKNSSFNELRELPEYSFRIQLINKIKKFCHNEYYNSLAVNYLWGISSSELNLEKRIDIKNNLSINMLKYKSNF